MLLLKMTTKLYLNHYAQLRGQTTVNNGSGVTNYSFILPGSFLVKEKRQKMKGKKCKGKVDSMGKFKNVCEVSGGKKSKQKEHTKTLKKTLEEMVEDHITSTELIPLKNYLFSFLELQ